MGHLSEEGSRRKHIFVFLSKRKKEKKKHLWNDPELIDFISGLDVRDWNFTVVLQFDLTVEFSYNLVHVWVWRELVL